MTPREYEDRRITVRMPAVLAARIDAKVRARRSKPGSWKFSMNDWFVETAQLALDGAVGSIGGHRVVTEKEEMPEQRRYVDPETAE